MTSRHPSTYPGLSPAEVTLTNSITTFTRQYFQYPKFDSSHDFQHVMRVTNTAMHILDLEQLRRRTHSPPGPPLDPAIVILGALLHDVDDKKYSSLSNGPEQPENVAKSTLMRFGASDPLTAKVSDLIPLVSFSTESKQPHLVAETLRTLPELGVVQDADRLDAIGAIGVGRCFTFGGAKATKGLGNAIEHFEEKLLKLESMMKTETGREMAVERSRRIREFMSWWIDEGGPATGLGVGGKGEDEWL